MYVFSKTINGKETIALFARVKSEWRVITDNTDSCLTIDLYMKDFETNERTQWIHRIETEVLPHVERDPAKYEAAVDRMERMMLHASYVIKNRETFQANGLLAYGPPANESVIRRYNTIVERFSEHVKVVESFGITADITDDMAKAQKIIATAFVLSEQEKQQEKGGLNGIAGTTSFTN